MNIDQQVVSLELARRLKELGVKQDGYYCYFNAPDIDGLVYEENWNLLRSQLLPLSSANLKSRMNSNACISAFTVAELGALLPETWRDNMIRFDRNEGAFEAEIMDDAFYISESTEANARAKMLIHLLEQGLIKNDQ